MVNAITTREGRRMSWKVTHACVRGSSHVRSGLPNQDSALCTVRAAGPSSPAVAIAAVADGHGSARHFRSQIGSSLAVSTAVTVLQDFLSRLNAENRAAQLTQEALHPLLQSLVDSWITSVEADLGQNPFTAEELEKLEEDGVDARASVEADPLLAYGATLLVAAATDSLVMYLQLGDGEILSVSPDGQTTRPLYADERLVGNQTTSLCQPDAWREFRVSWTLAPDLPALVLLSTDGYVNSFRSDEDFLKIGNDYLELLREEGISTVAEELPHILEEATQQGSGDDITLAILQGELRSPGESVPVPVRPPLSSGSRSALIEQLKARHSSQNHKLDELAARLEDTNRRNRRLRLAVILMLVAAALAGAGYFFRGRLFPNGFAGLPFLHPPVHTDGDKGAGPRKIMPMPSDREPKKEAVITGWELTVGKGSAIPLEKGHSLTESQVIGDGQDRKYLRIAADGGNMILINDSKDDWTVVPSAGKKSHKVGPGETVALKSGGETITFRKNVVGTISPQVSKPEASASACCATPPTSSAPEKMP